MVKELVYCEKKLLKEVKEQINGLQNYYPKDIFLWDNKEKITLSRGRFNEFIFSIVENVRKDILKLVDEIEND